MNARPSTIAAETSGNSAIADVFASPGFTRFWIANVLTALVNGSSRFVFVWLIGDLTDWDAAATLLGIAAGMPALLISAQAGLLVDRISPRKFGMMLLLATTACFAGAAAIASSSLNSVPTAMASAFVCAFPIAATTPLYQALVPLIVPKQRILQAVALQNMGGMVALMIGGGIAGVLIDRFSTAAALWFLAGVGLAAFAVFATADLANEAPDTGKGRQRLGDAATLVFRTEPLRTLMFLSLLTGIATATNFVLIPIYARDVLGVAATKASLINVAMGFGMIATSLVVAKRSTPNWPGRVTLGALSIGLGTGLVLIGLSSNYQLTLVFAALWGLCGGVAMSGLRALMQTNTPPEMMGRVMGLASVAQFGSMPLGSAILYFLVEYTSIQTALISIGLGIAVLVWAQWFRPAVRDLRS